MDDTELTSGPAIKEWLQAHTRKGDGLSRPYGRRWEIAGRARKNSLWTWPADRLGAFATALSSLGVPVIGTPKGVRVDFPGHPVWVGINRSSRGEGPPDSFSVRFMSDALPDYVGDSPEVVEELLRAIQRPSTPSTVASRELQVGFPGADEEPTYVGSPEWDVHGEARGAAALSLAKVATMAAIGKARL